MAHAYHTITGRTLGLGSLTEEERAFLGAVRRKYEEAPEWSEFGSWWFARFQAAGLSRESVTYRICQDLEGRLGFAQGMVAPPDYRDYLADLIEERYGSHYRFCKETGVDPGHLSRVLASRSDLSLRTLQRVLDALGATLIIQPKEELADRFNAASG
jgi:transcriptional regulator with XRE-family HTH domain